MGSISSFGQVAQDNAKKQFKNYLKGNFENS